MQTQEHKLRESSALFIALVVATGSIAINAGIPGAVDIEAAFELVSGSGSRIVGTFVSGYALGHILVGLLSQSISQRTLLIIGLLGFVACSVLISLSTNANGLAWFRGAQGLFASTCPIIGRALVRQMGTTQRAAKRMSSASAIFTWAPVIAPLIAGALAKAFGWQSVYMMLAAYGTVGALWVALMPVERFAARDPQATFKTQLRALPRLNENNHCRAGIVSGALAFAGFFSFLAVAPNLYQNWEAAPLSLSTAVAIFTAGYALGAVASRLALHFISDIAVLTMSMVLMICVSALQSLLVINSVEMIYILGCSFFYSLAAGAAMPNATILAMKPSAALAPLAVAFLGMLKMALAAVVTWLTAWSDIASDLYMSVIMLTASLAGLVFLWPLRATGQVD